MRLLSPPYFSPHRELSATDSSSGTPKRLPSVMVSRRPAARKMRSPGAEPLRAQPKAPAHSRLSRSPSPPAVGWVTPAAAGWEQRHACFGINLGIGVQAVHSHSQAHIVRAWLYHALDTGIGIHARREPARAAASFFAQTRRHRLTRAIETAGCVRAVFGGAGKAQQLFYRDLRDICDSYVFELYGGHKPRGAQQAALLPDLPVIDPPLCPHRPEAILEAFSLPVTL